jgi:hypothetical protein
MALTVVGLFAKYGPRLGPWVGLADLPEAITAGLNELGIGLAGTTLADGDLSTVAVDQYNQFDDMVMARAYETILLNLTADLLRENGINEKPEDVRPLFERRLAKIEQRLKDKYGIGLPVPSAGIISLDFQQRRDDTVDGITQG